jgi:PadR family transcriptional regulator PadR
MQRELRVTPPIRQVVAVLLSEPSGQHYGLDIAHRSGLPLGSIYPVLARLQRMGWVVSGQETIAPDAKSGRRPRCHYRLTGLGTRLAWQLQASFDTPTAPVGRSTVPRPRPLWP